eukprot:6677053-Pyramimonas_sp.AAC.1
MAVLHRVVSNQYNRYPDITARVLMDDFTMQWQGPDPRGADILHTCVRNFGGDVRELGLILQNSKS